MTTQDKIIGNHPMKGLFNSWTNCKDTSCSNTKRHRNLMAKEIERQSAIDEVAKWLITYHLTESKQVMLKKKKDILEKYEFDDYAKTLHIFPNTDKTKKGNLGEVILTEYLSETTGIKVLIYKFHYNPNVDQSMKGDDVLLIDDKKIILGESKFRKKPTKQAVEEAAKSMKDSLALPSSLGFLAETLMQKGKNQLAEQILDIQFKISKTNFDIKNIGFLLSDETVERFVENNIESQNKEFAFLSFGIREPEDFLKSVFEKAEELLMGGI